ncbi:MAG: type II secretion system minor pseudopilin GspJ [Thiomicrospira sp.]|nr:type II secretion system minor pseudopilin GspJ [Thiomicrospira sp.]
MAVSAVIAIMAYQSIDSAVRITESYERQQQDFSQLQRTIWWLEQDVLQMTPRPVLDELGSVIPAMLLQPQRFELSRIALYPTPQSSGGLVRVAYVLDAAQLYRWVWPVLDRTPDSKPNRQLLLSGVARFDVRLLDQQQQWQGFWPQEAMALNALPGLVEIMIELEDGRQFRRLLSGVEG